MSSLSSLISILDNLVATMRVVLRHTQACAFFRMYVCMRSCMCMRACAGMCMLWETASALALQAQSTFSSSRQRLSLVWNSTSRLSWLTPQGPTCLISISYVVSGWNLGFPVCTASTSLKLSYQPRLCSGIWTQRQRGSGLSYLCPLVSWPSVWRSGCS